MSEYPEHEKLFRVSHVSQELGQFLEWLESEGVTLARWVHDGGWPGPDDWRLTPDVQPIPERLAEYFGVSVAKIEDEKRAMLADLRGEG